jgi:hypothetical protein
MLVISQVVQWRDVLFPLKLIAELGKSDQEETQKAEDWIAEEREKQERVITL